MRTTQTTRNRLKTMFLQAAVQGAAGQAQLLGRMADVAAVLAQGLADERLFRFLQVEGVQD